MCEKSGIGIGGYRTGQSILSRRDRKEMATITIPDEYMKAIGLTESELLVEFACRLFDAGKLRLTSAARLAGLDRVGMEDALMQRKIAIYRPTIQDMKDDLAAFDRLGI
jgi:predicted HTH domain antitoxin